MTTQPEMTKQDAIQAVRDMYEAQQSNPGEPKASAARITINVQEDEEDGLWYWYGSVHDRDGSSVDFDMPDHYPDACEFNY